VTAVEIRALVREYRSGGAAVRALDGIDLDVAVGEVHGLLGPNGAGKTTLCKILSTVLLPTSGTVRLLGRDVTAGSAAVKRDLGIVLGGDRGLYGRLTGRQNVRFWAALYGLRRAELDRRTQDVLDRVGLAARADERVDGYSRGMKQRLHLARGMVSDPPVLILDEPTVGMDPVAAQGFRALVGDLRADGRTILLTTHDMAEAASLCDRVSLLDHGRILTTAPPDEVGALISVQERVDASGVPDSLGTRLRQIPGVVSLDLTAGVLHAETSTAAATSAVLSLLVSAGVTALSTGRPSLAEAYLAFYGTRGLAVER
jgi:ABC-2 type transport system ATP-binding protein